MATWNDWFIEANQYGIDLGLTVDSKRDIKRLEESGLKHFKKLVVHNLDEKKIKPFFDKYQNVWVRVVNLDSSERKYMFDIKNYDSLMDFLNEFRNGAFEIFLFENCDTLFGGNINTLGVPVIELVKGPQDLVGKSKAPFFHGIVNFNGRLTFIEENVSLKMKKAANEVMKELKLSRGRYIRGYFEFLYSRDGQIYFLDYKLGFGNNYF